MVGGALDIVECAFPCMGGVLLIPMVTRDHQHRQFAGFGELPGDGHAFGVRGDVSRQDQKILSTSSDLERRGLQVEIR